MIRTIPDFPKKGIMFRDITTLLKDKKGFHYAIDKFYKRYKGKKIDFGVENRFKIEGELNAKPIRTISIGR